MENYVIYKRLSKADATGAYLGMDSQQTVIDNFLSRQPPYKIIASFEEVMTGTSKKVRPLFTRALEICLLTDATLLISKLDRASRSVAVIANLMESKVKFVALDNEAANPLTIYVLSALASHEATAISGRVKAALAETRKRGTILGSAGRFNLKPEDRAKGRVEATKKIKQNALQFAERIRPILLECKAKQLTLVETTNYLNSLQIKTSRNKNTWHCSSVSNVLKTLNL